MAISYPVTPPSAFVVAELDFHANSIVGESRSPFTMEEQIYVHQGEWWEADVTLPPLTRADAEAVIAMLVSLNGKEGTFLMGDPVGASPRGNWGGSPAVNGALSAGVKTIAMDGFTASTGTVKAGDWFQIGSGSATNLHKVMQDATANGSGQITLEIWPRTRVALADNATFTTSSPKGIWRLASNRRSWSIRQAQVYGIRFSCVEALNP